MQQLKKCKRLGQKTLSLPPFNVDETVLATFAEKGLLPPKEVAH